ncbi:DDE superfamily endonuclease, partial [Prauserella aidingensis]|uniref:transposase family protein n=3 Tax=Prauserella aidingensis TaxID=387890 RepID=UPI0020A38044
HDLVAAYGEGAIGALCATATKGLPTLADKAYQGAGIGIRTPFKNPADGNILDVDNRCHNMLLTRLRCLGERGAAILTTRWKTLNKITLCPRRIGAITKAALVLTQFEHDGRY